MSKAESEEQPAESEPLITEDLLEEFKELYREEFGVELPNEDALERALNVVRLFKAIYRPIPVDPDRPAPPQVHPGPSDDHPDLASDSGKQLTLF